MKFKDDIKDHIYSQALELFLNYWYLLKFIRLSRENNLVAIERDLRKNAIHKITVYYQNKLLSKEEIINIVNRGPSAKDNLLPFVFSDFKYCLYCNFQIDEDTVFCQNCKKEVSIGNAPEFNLQSIVNLTAIENSYHQNKNAFSDLNVQHENNNF